MSNNSVNLEILQELKEIMEDEFDELVSIFIADGKDQIERLKSAITASEANDVRQIAHTLKGSSANLGLNKLTEICQTLEHNAADNQLDDANEILQEIFSEYETVKMTLEKLF